MTKNLKEVDKLKIGSIVEVECNDLDLNGDGISRFKNWVLITPNLLPDEIAVVTINYKRGSRYYTNLVKHKGFSVYRNKPKCNVYDLCGGCSIQHLGYTEQINIKRRYIEYIF